MEIRPFGLTLPMLRQLEDPGVTVAMSAEARTANRAARKVLDAAIAAGRRIYGVTTGPGPLADQAVAPELLAEAQRRLVLSNSAGVGPPLPARVVRRVMVLKLATFAAGASGVSEGLVDRLETMLNADLLPVIPAKGSVGASGDLAPLAHLGACLMGEGEAALRGVRIPAARALAQAGITPFTPGPKDGLALVNGTQVSTALAVEGLFRTEERFADALACAALSVDAGSGTVGAFDPRIQALRGQAGQAAVAGALRALLEGSGVQADRPVPRVQDPYCLRCLPQVMGAVHDQIVFAAGVLDRELRAVTDNPLIDVGTGDVLFGGNFHAQPIGLAADGLALALAEIGSMSERRVAFLVDTGMSGLPAFLVDGDGADSGFMVAQVTAAALSAENKTLASAVSIDSIPTAANQEDYVSMATHAARRLGDMTENLRSILSIELLAAAQGLDLRRPARSSAPLEALHARLRAVVPYWVRDRYIAPDIEAAGALLDAAGARMPQAESLLPSLSQG